MKITYICPTNHVRRPISELSHLLAEKGHKVSVAYPNSKTCDTSSWAPNRKLKSSKTVKSILIDSWFISSVRYNIPKFLNFKFVKTLREIFKADIVHMWEYWYPINVFVMFYALVTGQRKKLIMTTDGLVGYSYKPKDPKWLVPAFKLYTRSLGWFLFRIPKHLTTYGRAMLPFAKKAKVPMKRLTVQGTGIHLDKFQNVSEKEVNTLREEFGIKKDQQVLLFVGMLSERKGIGTLIQVATNLLKSEWSGKVLVVGKAEDGEDYQKFVQKDLFSSIIFTGGRFDIPVLMKLADCLLLPSEGEGLPGVVMEAMASGTACVATNEGCTPDLIDSGKNGFLVEFADTRGYTESVKLVLKNSKKFGAAAYEKISGFAWDKVASEYEKYYQKILS